MKEDKYTSFRHVASIWREIEALDNQASKFTTTLYYSLDRCSRDTERHIDCAEVFKFLKETKADFANIEEAIQRMSDRLEAYIRA